MQSFETSGEANTARPQHEKREWLTANEAAEYLRLKPRTLLLWARQGKIKGFRLSGNRRHVWRFRTADLDDILLQSGVPSVLTEGKVQ
jgi:excisionase family DNA binding protein